jgi:hypothetical protein
MRKLDVGKRRTPGGLYQEAMNLAKQTEACKKAFEQTSAKEIETKEKIARQYIHSFTSEYLVKIDILARVSPKTAKVLKEGLVSWEKDANESFTTDYSTKYDFSYLSVEKRADQIAAMRSNTVDIIINQGMALRGTIIDTCMAATFEAITNSGKRPSMQINEYLSTLLLKHFPKYLKFYEGAWQAFESDNPDKFRHVCASLRELIRNLLGDDADKRKDTLKLLSSSETENDLIESLVGAVYANDRLINKGVHSELEENVATLSMRTSEIIIQYVLERQKST